MKPKLLAAQIAAALTIQAAGHPVAQIPGRLAVRAAASAGEPAELIVYGDIGDSWYSESVAAADVVRALADIDASAINVRINSYGGSVTDGLAIYNALKRHPARIDVTIDGIAASIASLIAMAGDSVSMPANALLMIHAPWGGVYGNAAELRQYAAVLDVYSKAMATSYAAKTGSPYDDMLALVADGADHYYTAAEALAAGFADAIVDDAAATDAAAAGLARVSAQAAFARYSDHAPAAIAASLRTPIVAPAPAAAAPVSPAANAGDTQPDASAPGAQKERTMDPNKNAPTAADVSAAATAATDAALAAQRDRNTGILAAARPHADNAQIVALRDEALADTSMTLDAFNARALAVLGAAATPSAGAHTPGGGDESDKRRGAMEQAIEARVGVAKPDASNPFRGLAMRDIARECARAAGVRVDGMDPMDMVKAAITHSSSDFPLLLGNVVRRQVLAGYEAAEEIYPLITRAMSVPDFRPTSLSALGHFTGIRKVGENGEYKFGKFDEMGQSVTLTKSGAMFGISREAIINDDLSVFSEVPRKMGEAAKADLGDRVIALLTSNPVLADNVVLFHADHGNLASPGGAISTATVDGMRVLMATQKTASGKTIRIRLKYLVVPVGKGGVARTVMASEFEVGASTRNNTTPNTVRNTFEVLEDPRLDDADPNAWYGIADPANVAGIVIAYRDGVQEPTVEQKDGWSVDGVEFKVRLEAEPAIADARGLAKNPGA